jgi:tetratricopeptide (TPR) repeat protein
MMFTWVMDHFLYIPMISLIALLVAGLGWASSRLQGPLRPVGAGVVLVGVALLAHASHAYAGLFSNRVSLYTYTVQHYPDAPFANEHLGRTLMEKGEIPAAIGQFQEAVRKNPRFVEAHFDLGSALMQTNQLAEARDQFEETIRLDSHHADAYDNLGATLLMLGQPADAIKDFRQSLAIFDYAQPHNDLGNTLVKMGRVEEAIAEYQKAVALEPGVAQLHDNLGLALVQQKRIPEAAEQFEMAQKIDPHDDAARTALGYLQGAPKSGQ